MGDLPEDTVPERQACDSRGDQERMDRMTLRRQLLLLLLVHIMVALAAWDGYRIGLKRGRAESRQVHPRVQPERSQDANWRLN